MEQTYIIPVETTHYIGADADNISQCPLANAIRDFFSKQDIKFYNLRVYTHYVKFIKDNRSIYFKMMGWHEELENINLSDSPVFASIIMDIKRADSGEEIDTKIVTLTKFDEN